MHTVSVATAKAHLSEILSKIEEDEEVVITKRGQSIARILGFQKKLKMPPSKELETFRSTLPESKTSSTDLLRKLRDEEY